MWILTLVETFVELNCSQLPLAPPVLLPDTPHSDAVQARQASKQSGTHPATPVKTKPRIERNRVLVTGGAGFVGSHLCTFLVERGDHVRSLPLVLTWRGHNLTLAALVRLAMSPASPLAGLSLPA